MLENKEIIWKDIKGYSKYQINNYGDIWSKISQRKLKPFSSGKNGYLKITITADNGKSKKEFIHRLVALAFLPLDENKTIVNHKDGNKLNNYVDNLEWCTPEENNKHSARVLGTVHTKKCRCIETGRVFNTISEAEEILGICHVSDVCRGERKTAGGYHWEYA